MNSFSHYMVGRFLHRYIRKEYGIKLNAACFVHWNIMADFRKPYHQQPHKEDCWVDYLKREIVSLAASQQAHTPLSTNDTKHLGIVCHFYTDFFCYPHTAAYKGTYWQHLKYEWELYMFMRKKFSTISLTVCGGSKDACRDAHQIHIDYQALQNAYLSKTPSFENDIVYTLRACLGAVVMITGASIREPVAYQPMEDANAIASIPSF